MNSRVTEDDVKEINSWKRLLKHRGPDQQGSYVGQRVVIINNRLKIMDLTSSRADLPILSSCKKVLIAFNGEITNFKELKNKYLGDTAQCFTSESDSEVLLHLYLKFGIACIEKLVGMFSICIYDMRISKVYLIRDPFGITPLFYFKHNEDIYFSSELKAIISLNCFTPNLNSNAINHFLSLAYIPKSLTPYEGVEELLNGEYVEVNLKTNNVSRSRYHFLNYKDKSSLSEKEIILQAKELLIDSVRRNLRADAEVGLTLSGGLDTSTILSIAKKIGLAKNMKTFSLSMVDKSFDESTYQRYMAKFAQTNHHEIRVDNKSIYDSLHTVVAHMDEPLGDGAAVPLFLLAKYAKKYVKVLISGEGGDEVFNAYETHGAFLMKRLYTKKVPPLVRKFIFNFVKSLPVSHRKLSFDFLAKRFTEGSELGVPESHIYWRHPFTNQDKAKIFSSKISPDITDSMFCEDFEKSYADDDLDRISSLDINHFFYGDLMLKSDRVFMANSIEGRFPFMDKNLVDFMTSVPSNIRIKNYKRRYVQKMAMQGVVPKKILKRTNFGLELPNSVMLSPENNLVKKYLNKESLGRSGLFDVDYVSSLIKEHHDKKRDLGRGLWCLLNFQIWFDMFIYNKNFKEYMVK